MLPKAIKDAIENWPNLGKSQRKELGRALRSQGLSYAEIQQMIPVSKGTLSGWCRGLDLNEAQSRALEARSVTRASLGRLMAAEKLRARNDHRILCIRQRAKAEAELLVVDPEWLAGVVAYWCEGAKDKEVRFSNSDPGLISLFLEWAQRYLDIDKSRVTLTVHLHEGQEPYSCIRYWSCKTGISMGQFGRPQFKKPGSGHRKKTLYQGTLQIRVSRSTDLLYRIQGWMEYLEGRSYASVTLADGPLAQR